MSFDSNAYWLERGKNYIHEKRFDGPFHKAQEDLIVLYAARFNPRRIVDIGCGFGRITKRLAEAMPDAEVWGIDLSPVQIQNGIAYCYGSGVHLFSADLLRLDFEKCDVCVAAELFLHLRRADLIQLVPKIMAACPVLIHDFDVNPDPNPAPHVFYHDYAQIYSRLGLNATQRTQGDIGLMIVRPR